jgi:hypothetical protein
LAARSVFLTAYKTVVLSDALTAVLLADSMVPTMVGLTGFVRAGWTAFQTVGWSAFVTVGSKDNETVDWTAGH